MTFHRKMFCWLSYIRRIFIVRNHFAGNYSIREAILEALEQETPASIYEPSRREMPNKLAPLEYPDRFEVRYVSKNGGIRWNKNWVNVSVVCAGEYVGLEEIDDGIWNVYFGPLKLGRFHDRQMRTEDEYGRIKRKQCYLCPRPFNKEVTIKLT